ncbi:MAG: N-6 DNA methylase [Bryobacterales bacterium]|nr:N-6 DNA methylase [Bryobacterales bacterium]
MATTPNVDWIASYIWGIADDVLRDIYVRGKYRDVILPMTVLRRLDAVLEPTKGAVLDMKAALDAAKVDNQDPAIRQASGQAFYNTSKFTLHDLRARASRQRLRADFEDYLDGFSPNVQEILDNFEFRNQIPRLSKADALGSLIEKLTSPDVNLSPVPVVDTDGTVRHPGLDNHGMGTVFEELIRRFNEDNNEEAGEHFTPRDAVTLMARLIFLPVAEEIEDGTYLLYDGACGTGGMLTVAEDVLQQLARERGKQVSTHLFGQEINAETYAICKADLLLKGEGEAADNIMGGPEHSTLSNDAFPSREFDFMLSNPPYGKSWKTDLARMGGKKEMRDHRFVIEHAGDPEYSLVTRSSDGQMLFLANKLSKMKRRSKLGSRIAEVHNGSSLFTGSAGQGESNIRRWMIENDWLEGIVALPLNMFYNTGIATYVWVLTNRKSEIRKGKVQLIDATKWYRPLRKNLGKKNCELGPDDIDRICRTFQAFEESEESKVFENESFGYWKVTVERPLRLRVDLSKERLDLFHADCVGARDSALSDAVHAVALREGSGPHRDFSAFKEAVKRELRARGGRATVTLKRRRLLEGGLAERDENAQPVVRKVLPRSAVADPIQGRFQDREGRRPRVVEYEPDTQLRDTEQIALVEAGGIEGFLRREVLPYAEDAWYVPKTVKIGYEISFNRYFYKPKPMRTLEEISADIASVEREADGLLGGLLARQMAPTHRKLRVYADTSVISGCEDDGFREASRRLIDRCSRGELTLVVSGITTEELARAPQAVRDVLSLLNAEELEWIESTDDAESLAQRYIEDGVLTETSRADALHIAMATVAGVDVLVSWNFRHMVNLRRILAFNAVNRAMGHPSLEIRTPKELDNDE